MTRAVASVSCAQLCGGHRGVVHSAKLTLIALYARGRLESLQVTNVLGLPKPLTTRRKFLLRRPPPSDLDWAAEGVKKVQRFNVEET